MPREISSLPVAFRVGDPPAPITAADAQWRLSLPADRHAGPSAPASVSYGDYFTAAADYLNGEGRTALTEAVRHGLGRDADLGASTGIQVHLVKHGAFYHPARVTVAVGERRLDLVLNVAVSPAGRERLVAEAAHMMRLASEFSLRFTPRVHGSGFGRLAHREPLPMFLGEWLDGFHELHPTAGPDGERPWAVWDPDRGRWHLSQRQMADLFSQAVFILTYYFDPITFEAVQAWHHAAGDFVVRPRGAGLEVRLITVRRYAPLFRLDQDDAPTLERLLEALALFFLRTSLWMRLDRLDGVGDLTWADDRALMPMWHGFVHGLKHMAQHNDLPEAFVEAVMAHMAGQGREGWLDLGGMLIAQFPADLPETGLLRCHLAAHAEGLAEVVAAQGF